MQKGWDDIINQELQNQTKIKCCLKFKYKNKKIFAESTCRECYGKLEYETPVIKNDEKDESEDINVKVNVVNKIDEKLHLHDYKRKVKNQNRDNFKKKLNVNKPLVVHNELVLNYGTTLNPLVPNISMIRKISSERKKKRNP